MLVRDRMSTPAVTVSADTPFQDALSLMREREFRRLPVVNPSGELVGIVSERDLLHASPSPATSLSVWEMNYLLWKLKISDVMTEKVITVTPDLPIEEAALVMIANRIGGMPVVSDAGELVGVITETDIFKAFTELLGAGEHGLRVEVRVPNGKGVLATLARTIADLGGNILSVGSYPDKSKATYMTVLKVAGVDKEPLMAGITAIGDEIVDARIV